MAGPNFPGRRVEQPSFPGQRVSYYETAAGRATPSVRPDGTLWLDFEDGRSGAASTFEGLRPVMASTTGPRQTGDGSKLVPRPRSLVERFMSTASDQAMRNPLVAVARWALPDTTTTHTDPNTGATFEYRSLGRDLRDDERARRDTYEANIQGDRWYNAPGGWQAKSNAAVATLAGALTGGASDPLNAIGGFGRSALTRILSEAGVNAGGDVLTQAADIGADIQRDGYSPTQTAVAAGIGGLFQGGLEAVPIAGRAVETGGRKALSFAGRRVEDVRSNAARALANPVPSFDGPSIATGPVQQSPSRVRRAAPAIQTAIDNASSAGGVSRDYMTALAQRESNFNPTAKAGTSTATGLYQFTERTWLNTLAKHGAELGMPDAAQRVQQSPSAVLALRNDPQLNAHAAALLTRDNAAALGRALGRAPTQAELYSAHFLGESSALRLATSEPRAAAAELFPEAAAANRSIFFDGNRARSVQEVQANFAKSFSGLEGGASTRAAVRQDRPDFASQASPAPEALQPVTRPAPDYAAAFREQQAPVQPEPAAVSGRRTGDEPAAPLPGSAPRPLRDVLFDGLGPLAEPTAPALRVANNLSIGPQPIRQDLARPTSRLARAASPDFSKQARAVGPDASTRPQAFAMPEPVDTSLPMRTGAADDALSAALARANEGSIDPGAVRGVEPSASGAPSFPGRRLNPDEMSPAADAPPGRLAAMAAEPSGRLNIDLSSYGDRINNPTLPSSGQTVGGLRDAPRPGAVARGEGSGGYAGQTVAGLASDLRNALGITHRQGRVSMRGAVGEYDTGSAVVRTKAVQELDVLAHEATHALEYQRNNPALQQALRAHGQELAGLAYPGAPRNVVRQEGFAEFGRWYLTNPERARAAAPNFYDAFERALQQDAPTVGEKLRGIQDAYQTLLQADSIEVAKSAIAYTGSKGPIRDLVREMRERGPGSMVRRLAHNAYTALIDDKHPIAQAVQRLERLHLENAGKKIELRPSRNPYTLSRLTPDANAAGLNDVLHGVTPYQGLDPEGPSLADALERAGIKTKGGGSFVPDALREFDAYLISRRMVHEWDRFSRGELPRPPDRNTKAFHQQVIDDAEALHPQWGEAASTVYDWQNNLWRKEFEAGLITREAYESGLNDHPDYVPLMRDMSDKGPNGRGGKPRGALQYAGGVKAFEGSTRDVISPLSSMMRRSYELNAIIKRNDVMKALEDLADAAGPGSGAIVEKLPARQLEAIQIDAAEALRRTGDELGLTGRDLTTLEKFADDADGSTVTLFRPTEFSPRKGEAVVFVWRDGKKTPLLLPDGEFGQAMFTALTGMNKELQNVVVDAAAAGTQLLRYGVTLSPEFMAANIVRDALATWINSGTGFVPFVDTLRGGIEAVRGGRDAIRYGSAGGMRGGANVAALARAVPRTDAEAQLQLQALNQRGFRTRRMMTNPLRALAEATDLSETATRLGVFKRGFDEAKRQGMDDYDALIQSTFLTRDYMDFGRRGSKMVAASRIVTFLNAALQGLDKTGRVLSADGSLRNLLAPLSKAPVTPAERAAYSHAYKAWAKVAALGAFGLGLRMLYADDPEYQEIGDQLRATHWVFRAGGQWVFVPKPFELAALSNVLERAYEGAAMRDPTAGERLLSDLTHTVAPPTEVPSLAVPFQIGRNRDHLGRPIVPDHLRGTVEPALQFNSYTSDLGKMIGKTFGVSPAVVDHVVTGFGGSLGRYVLQGSNILGEAVTGRPRTAAGPEDTFLARRFVREISRGSTSQKEFWKQMSRDAGEMTKAEGSYRSLTREGKDEEAVSYLNRLPAQERAFVVARTMMPEGMSIVHPLVRAERAVSVVSDFRRDVRAAELRDMNGAVIQLTPEDRRQIDGALADFAMAEMRNALTDARIRGWEQRQPLDPAAAADRVRQVSPAVYDQLWTRLALEKAPTVIWPEAHAQMTAAWTQQRPLMERPQDAASLVPFIRARRVRNGDRAARFQEAQKMAGGAY